MEPKISETSKGFRFPYEPSFSEPLKRKEELIPRIVPAELQSALVTRTEKKPVPDSTTEQNKATTSQQTVKRKDPREIMASLSKDLEDLSTPLDKSASKNVMEAPETNPEEQEEAPSPSGVLRSIMLFICFVVVCLCTWQVALFLQPSIMQQEPLNSISEKSCKFFYCPPMRPMRILTTEMNAVGEGNWIVTIQLQNQDMRTQPLPNLQVSLTNTDQTKYQKTFTPSQYTILPEMKDIKGGLSVKIQIPVTYSEGRPSNFSVKVLD